MAPPCHVEHGVGVGAPAGTRGSARWTRGSRASGLVAAPPFIGHRCFAGDEAERRRSQGHGAAALLNGRERTEGHLSTRSSPRARGRCRGSQGRSDDGAMVMSGLGRLRGRRARFRRLGNSRQVRVIEEGSRQRGGAPGLHGEPRGGLKQRQQAVAGG
jgi:hypothetical protein